MRVFAVIWLCLVGVAILSGAVYDFVKSWREYEPPIFGMIVVVIIVTMVTVFSLAYLISN